MTERYIAYTDGGCSNTSRYGEGGSAYIIIQDGKIIKTASKGFLNTTNNKMEMLAIISAVCSIPHNAEIDIYSDSEYAMNVLSGRWKGKKNKDLIKLYRNVTLTKVVRFHWVKGHAGIEYNELVDNLCTEAMRVIVESNKLPDDRFTKRKDRK